MTPHVVTPRNIAVVGLGKLGAPIAACYAEAGHHVTGVDLDPRVVETVSRGLPPVAEPGLGELMRRAKTRLRATSDLGEAISCSEITIIIVPTPSDGDGGFSLAHVLRVCEEVGAVLRRKTSYHLVLVTSTVLPGAVEGTIKPFLEARSGRRCGVDFGLCYCPEFVALGSVIRDLQSPDFLLVGESDAASGQLASEVIQSICINDPTVARMNIVNAEIAKLAVNTYVTTKITFANMLARLCEALPGAHIDTVTGALGLDRRIGRHYLKGAIGFGGPCFPRDNVALSVVGRQLGVDVSLAETVQRANQEQTRSLLATVKSVQKTGGTTGILGLAYKPNTNVTEESPGIGLARALLAEGMDVLGYDPAVRGDAALRVGEGIRVAGSARECCRGSDVVVVVTPWDEFKELGSADFAPERSPVVVDCWRILDPSRLGDQVEYLPLGVGPCLQTNAPADAASPENM
jgi:UDPglucose 6-dehydrogenase